MFTGIIERSTSVVSIASTGSAMRIRFASISESPLLRGESVAVNGVCLTALPAADGSFEADISAETLRLSNLGALRSGSVVNIERAMMLGDRLSGHIVQGHVDARGQVERIERDGDFATIRWSYPKEFATLVVAKGSITVDGVSLTIVEPRDNSFAAALIPETLERTTLGRSEPGTEVNLEFDVIAKFVRQMVAPYLTSTSN